MTLLGYSFKVLDFMMLLIEAKHAFLSHTSYANIIAHLEDVVIKA